MVLASLATFTNLFKRPAKRFKINIAFSAIHVPKTFDFTDGDLGEGHVVDPATVVIPRMGPDRACLKGEAVRFYGADSALRGGGGATITGWRAYWLGTATPTDSDIGTGTDKTGTDVVTPSPDGGGNPATMTFTPTLAGHYRIEMDVAELPDGDGIDSPLPYMCKYVRVFNTASGKQSEWDAEGVGTINASGSMENGGWTATLSYKRGDGAAGEYPQHNQRIIFQVRTSFARPPTDDWEEYTWNPGHGTVEDIWYSPTIFLEGLVRGDSVVEDYLNHEVSFQVVGIRVVLDQLLFPRAPKVVPPGFLEETATAFMDLPMYDAFMAKATGAQRYMWVHRIAGMSYSDPVIHILQRHTNYCTFWDVNIWQNDTDGIPYLELTEKSIFAWIKKSEAERFGVVFTDAKGVLSIGPDPDLRGPDYWASAGSNADFVVDGDMYRDIHIQESVSNVGQVSLTSVDAKTLVPTLLQPTAGTDPQIAQLIQRKQYRALWPNSWKRLGELVEIFGVPITDRSTLATIARRLFKKLNKRYPSIQTTYQMLTGIDLMQNIGIEFDPRGNFPDGGWSGLLSYVTGVQMTINPNGLSWSTTLTTSEVVDAAAVEVTPTPPVAIMTTRAYREVFADGTEARIAIALSRAHEGDEAIASYLFHADHGGGTKTGQRAVWAFDDSVDSVTITHTVTDTNGLTSTVTKVIDFTILPDVPATFGETIWAVSDKGHHVSPDGGQTWIEDLTNFITPPGSPTIGLGRAVWATDDSLFGFFGNSVGQVRLTRDLGVTFLLATGTPASAVNAMWGDATTPSVFVGYENGQLWEVAYSKQHNVLLAAEVVSYRQGTRSTAPIKFVFFNQRLIFVGAGDSLYAGTRTGWAKLARFPGTILRGSARAEPQGGFGSDTAYSFVISLVFASGAQNFQEQGRVKVGEAGITWFSESIVPVPTASGTDTAIGAIDSSGVPILLTFDGATVPYLLPDAGTETPGPVEKPGVATPAMTLPIRAVEYGLDGRDHAFAGHAVGIYKNLDPNAPLDSGGAPAPTNLWLPFHTTDGAVRDLYITRPRTGEEFHPPVFQGGLVHILFVPHYALSSRPRAYHVVWVPDAEPPQYQIVEMWDRDEAFAGSGNFVASGNDDIEAFWHPWWARIGTMEATRNVVVPGSGGVVGSETIVPAQPLPLGYSYLSLFRLTIIGTGGVGDGTSILPGQASIGLQALTDGRKQFGSAWQLVSGVPKGHSATPAVTTVHADHTGIAVWPDPDYVDLDPDTVDPATLNGMWWYPLTGGGQPTDASTDRGLSWRVALRNDAAATKIVGTTYWAASVGGGSAGAYYATHPLVDGVIDRVPFLTNVVNATFARYNLDETVQPDVILSNEYWVFDSALYYVTGASGSALNSTPVVDESAVPFDGTGGVPNGESFAGTCFIIGFNSVDWKLYLKTSNTVYTRWVPPADFVAAFPNAIAPGMVCSDNLGTSAIFPITNDGTPYLIRAKNDSTWEDISGNLWQAVVDDSGTAPALFPAGIMGIRALRPVLDSEYPVGV